MLLKPETDHLHGIAYWPRPPAGLRFLFSRRRVCGLGAAWVRRSRLPWRPSPGRLASQVRELQTAPAKISAW